MTDLKLLELIKNNNIVSLKDLMLYTSVSESTIRRLLKSLELAGYIKMSYGGHIELIDIEVMSLDDGAKTNLNKLQKVRLGKMCADLIDDGDVIFVDNGTTVRYILKFLKGRDVTIYSNGYNHIQVAKEYNLDFNLIPGQVIYKEASIVGSDSVAYLNEMKFDCVFIGANGFDEMYGVTTPNSVEASLKKAVLKLGHKSFIVIDSNKYQVVSKCKICNFDAYPIVTLPL